jgi:hypothetical protein
VADALPDQAADCATVLTVTVQVGHITRSASRPLSPAMFEQLVEAGSAAEAIIDLWKRAIDQAHRAIDGHATPGRRRMRR